MWIDSGSVGNVTSCVKKVKCATDPQVSGKSGYLD